MKKCTERLLGLNQSTPETTTTHEPDEKTIDAWRVHLRDSGYLADPKSATEIHTSMKGVELDAQLLNMDVQAQSRRTFHARNLFDNDFVMPSLHDIPQPVFVTAEERDDFSNIANKTNGVIRSFVEELLEQLDSDEVQSHYKDRWKRTKNKKKEELIAFYDLVREEIEDQLPVLSLLEQDS